VIKVKIYFLRSRKLERKQLKVKMCFFGDFKRKVNGRYSYVISPLNKGKAIFFVSQAEQDDTCHSLLRIQQQVNNVTVIINNNK